MIEKCEYFRSVKVISFTTNGFINHRISVLSLKEEALGQLVTILNRLFWLDDDGHTLVYHIYDIFAKVIN
jgi:hypothetical protein